MTAIPTPPDAARGLALQLTDLARQLTARVFDEQGKALHLDAGQMLMREGQPQNRLYYIHNGFVVGYVASRASKPEKVMRAGTGDLVGVQSFFGGISRSFMTVVALVPTEMRYVERDWVKPDQAESLERQLMPAVIAELNRRHQMIQDLAMQQDQVNARMREMERTSALGELSAGVAHELNNAMTVIARGSEWVDDALAYQLNSDWRAAELFRKGQTRGRTTSTAEARARTAELRRRFTLSYGEARRLAQTGLTDDDLTPWQPVKDNLDALLRVWELGATLNDLRAAAKQAEYVVQSMRDLGADNPTRHPVNICESINIALQIVRNVTQTVQVETDLDELLEVQASRGRLVQVWSNLIKNAVDALNTKMGAADAPPTITLRAYRQADEAVVEIADNGPGIPPDIAGRIFEPSFTTKKSGLSFGLGLGLSIVQKVVTGYGGTVELVKQTTPGATFRVTLPLGGPSP